MAAIVAILILIFATIKFFGYIGRRQHWVDVYRHVGRRYHGKKSVDKGVSCPTIISSPTLSFNYRSTVCVVRSRNSRLFDNVNTVTQATLMIPWSDCDLEISTQQLKSVGRFSRLSSRLTFADPEFQARFKAAAQYPALAMAKLPESVQRQIDRLRRFGADNQVHLKIINRKLTISVPNRILDRQRLDDFVRMSLKLYDLMVLTTSQGLTFSNENQVKLVEDIYCPICCDKIETQMVVCVRCQTPHCADCWEYNGQCATFACKETRYTRLAGNSPTLAPNPTD